MCLDNSLSLMISHLICNNDIVYVHRVSKNGLKIKTILFMHVFSYKIKQYLFIQIDIMHRYDTNLKSLKIK